MTSLPRLSVTLSFLSSLLTSQFSYAKPVIVYAAASLTQSINQISAIYERQTQRQVISVFAASSTLARQIAHGAPADIFISANQKWMQYLLAEDRVSASTLTPLLENQLVLAAPSSSQIPADDSRSAATINLAELLQNNRLATGDTSHVPIGIYAEQALQSIGQWDSVKSKLALTGNSRSALLFIERATVPIGIVYKTDALSSSKVKIVASFSAASHDRIQYPIALVKHPSSVIGQPLKAQSLSAGQSPAAAFYDFLQSDSAGKIFRQHGFLTLDNAN
ncbi:MAG: hypothetical protein OFPII_32720 [Osedax symbiont Rs1]|nr:MAG: hypothetical protein OFPII_32720 [Osedax symbiont Rs1]